MLLVSVSGWPRSGARHEFIAWESSHRLAVTQPVVQPTSSTRSPRIAGNQKATRVVDTQKQAIDIARDIAINQESEVVIHRPNGQIRDKDSYGPDPQPPEG